ncbi:hypothetical protein BN946_scf185043.g68 [Trametes cinnabarina]|uniref:IMD domain-containing protein n=1 Tax=Pycnoporus cinnabarinus TaxID=5643 RepID=A0A060SP58_PYCCI|nr:hypothetical protein BN946_scf185043.g68 [Trametes cinnabarina]
MPRVRSLRTQTLSPKRDISPGPPSPTFTETTNASVLNFGPDGPKKIITRNNLKASLQAYEDVSILPWRGFEDLAVAEQRLIAQLLSRCATYRAALLTMSKAAAGFADSMEACSGLKGPTYESGTRMQAAAGLHHLMSNHFHVMQAETLDKQFEKPLRQHLENYRTVVNERSNAYERALREKSRIIRQTEMGNMKQKGRNLQTFREALAVLQRQVDELDELKARHYQEIVEHEEEVWDFVQGKICLVVRSTMDVFDRLTSKTVDPVIEQMLQTIPDPFDSYGPPPSEDQIFSILQPLSVIANVPSSTPSPLTSNPDLESSDGAPSAKGSWSAATGSFFPDTAAAWADVPSSPPSGSVTGSGVTTPARSVSPPSLNKAASTSALNRRHSHPVASASNHSRKSESKLRTVLSVIDESHSRQNGDSEDSHPRSMSADSGTSSSPTPNGKMLDLGHADASIWGGTSLNFGGEEGDITPQNTIRVRAQSSGSPSSFDGTPDAERSRSPRSDDTATPIPIT